jgi:PEGA domain
MNTPPPICRRAIVALALATLLIPSGCVRRRLAVRSNPPGALVFVDNQQIGTTPCSVDFTYYGTREIRLVKPGYETLTVNQPIPTPWYQIPPIDFVSENLLPNKILDHRTVAFNLEPQVIVPTEQLIDRANELRQATLQSVPGAGPVLPAGPPTVAPAGPPGYGAPPGTAPPFSAIPGTAPTPLPPVMQSSPPDTFAPNTYSPPAAVPGTPLPGTPLSPVPTIPPASPFGPPAIPAAPSSGSQQGPPLVSPPLR